MRMICLGMPTPSKEKGGFTLVEMLVVVAIIGILISMLLPQVQRAQAAAQSVGCQSQLRSFGTEALSYSMDRDGYLPWTTHLKYPFPPDDPRPRATGPWVDWMAYLIESGAVQDRGVFRCPADSDPLRDWNILGEITRFSYGINLQIAYPAYDTSLLDIPARRAPVLPIFGDCTVSTCTGASPAGGADDTLARARLAFANHPMTYTPDPADPRARHPRGSNVFFADSHVEEVSWERALYGHLDDQYEDFFYSPDENW